MNNATYAQLMETTFHILRELGALSVFWLPMVFAAYAIGRRQFSLRFVLIAISVEAVAMAYFAYRLRI